MKRNCKIIYSYTLEEREREIVRKWLKKTNTSGIELSKLLGISSVHLSRILHGTRNASSTVIYKMKRLGIRF
jgi:transcriptional regulator with XRE-family HTH domain